VSIWPALAYELDRWAEAGHAATFWWRDDDAGKMTGQLQRLLDLREKAGIGLALAAVPTRIDDAFRARMATESSIAVLQHGYSHHNFATPDERKIELDGSRPAEHVIAELAVGMQALRSVPGWTPVLVPPWNRIASEVVAWLPDLGYRGLCTFGGRAAPEAAPGLLQVDSHCDPIRWKGAPRFCGLEAALEVLVGHLAARRSGRVDANEPSGILTHHLETDEATWAFMEELLARTAGRPGARWIGLEALLQLEEGACV